MIGWIAWRVNSGSSMGGRVTVEREANDTPGYRGRRAAAQVVLLGAFGIDLLLYSLVVPFLPSEAEHLGASPVVTGVLFAMYAVGLFGVTPLAAWLTDRAGPRRTLLWGMVALAGATLLFAFSPTLSLGLPGLFVARTAQGAASTITWTAGLAVLAQLYTAEERPKIFARAFTVTGLGTLIGPPLGGALYSWGGFTLPFLFAAGLALLDGLGRVFLLPSDEYLPPTQPERGALRTLLRDGRFLLGLFAAMTGAVALSSLEPVTPLLLGGEFGLPTWAIGAVFGVMSLCFVLMQPAVSRSERRLGTLRTIAVGLAVSGGCFVALAFAPNVIVVLALLAVIGCAISLALIPAPELLTSSGQRLAGPNGAAYGAIYAAYNGAYAVGILIGPLTTGAAITAQGVAHSFLLLALAPAVSALALLLWRGWAA
jgi:MFS transporter, DHA1 family, solute carrier family 18 (vesicular amine transporter), member 1/2